MSTLDPEEVHRRKRELVERYADLIRLVVAYRLLAKHGRNVPSQVIDDHTKNILLEVIRQVPVNPWRPDRRTDAHVDRVIEKYVRKI